MEEWLERIDLNALLQQLVACASKWFLDELCFDPDDILPSTAKSATELAYDAVARFLEGGISHNGGENGLTQRELYLLLKTVMRHDFLDLVKPGRAYKRTDIYDTIAPPRDDLNAPATPSLDGIATFERSDFEDLDIEIAERKILGLIGEDKELHDYIRAVLRAGCIKREDIAAHLNVTPQEITNRQRRLRDRLAGWRQNAQPPKGVATYE